MNSLAAFLVGAVDDGPEADPRLVIRCARCGSEETVNDEEGTARVGELTAWAQEHECAS